MGRKPIKKERIDAPELKKEWVRILTPIYMRKGLRSMNMQVVAKTIGVSKATLYKYFSSREEIIEYALETKLEEIGAFKNQLFDNSLSFQDRYFHAIFVFFNGIAGVSNEFLRDLKNMYPNVWKKVEFFREYTVSMLQLFYENAIEAGIFKAVNPHILVMNDKQFFDLISDPDFLNEQNISIQEAFKDYFTLRISGLFNRSSDFDINLEEKIKELTLNIRI
ncbi:MAG: TetR/AcrR family transcriptional regulator [Chitinophagales bacterium]